MDSVLESRTLRLTLLLVTFMIATPAEAQPFERTLVATFGVSDRSSSLVAASQVEAQLVSRRVAIVSMHEARDRLVETSHAPRETSQADIDALVNGKALAVRHAAFGKAAEVQRTVNEVIARAERSIETLNRDSKNARQLMDTCLVQVRSLLHESKRDAGIEQAMQCRRLVPDLSPSPSSHPANVIGVLAEADDQLRRMQPGLLSVRAASGGTCSVYLNGRHLGTTPFTFERAAAGTYRVQVECRAERARVHVVRIGEQPAELVIDTGFDEAVVSEPRVGLVYAGPERARTNLAAHGARLGKDIRVDDVILVQVGAGAAELERIQVKQERPLASVSLLFEPAKGLDSAALGEALDALAQGRSVSAWGTPIVHGDGGAARTAGYTAGVASAGVNSPGAVERKGKAEWKLWSGIALLAAGASLEIGSWVLYKSRSDTGDAMRRELPMSESSAQDDWRDARAPMLALAGSGAAVAGTGAVLFGLSPPVRDRSWWLAGASGAAGAALGIWGAVDLVKAGSCTDEARMCVEEEQRQDRGLLLLAGAFPLGLVPITKLMRIETERLRAMIGPRGVRLVGAW